MSDSTRTDLDVVAELARRSVDVRRASDGATPFVMLGEGETASSLEALEAAPARIRGTVAVSAVQSFIEYVGRFGTGGTVLVADRDRLAFSSMLDYSCWSTSSR